MWLGVVRLLQERELMPAIAFGFSRNSLEVLAEHLSSVDLLSKSEYSVFFILLAFPSEFSAFKSDSYLLIEFNNSLFSL